jgi:hypothetical protein
VSHIRNWHSRTVFTAGSVATLATAAVIAATLSVSALTPTTWGLGDSGSAGRAAPAAPKAANAPAARTVSVDSGPVVCSTGQLAVTAGAPQGAAGSLYLQLTFTNISDRVCTLYGYSGVSLLTSSRGPQLGAAAARQPAGLEAVVVGPAERADETVRVTNPEAYPPSSCGLTPAAGLRVYPPDQTVPVWIPLPLPGCSSTSETLMRVWPIRSAA